MNEYHVPSLLCECLEGLAINKNGTYVDVTFGGGGHSRAMLEKLDNGRLFAFDQDPESVKNKLNDTRFELITQNFKYLQNYLKLYKVIPVDGILADLGVSFHQFDKAERGFSIRQDGPLDMRMNSNSNLTAEEVVNTYNFDNLRSIFWLYGELRESGKIASKIIRSRTEKAIKSTKELVDLLEPLIPFKSNNPGEQAKKRNQFLSKVFQAIRIEVNQELETLKSFLSQCQNVIKQDGRLVVISYHSLEDKLVKNFFKSGNFEGEQEKDLYGNILRPFEPVNRKVLVPNTDEIERNPRSRSAKLRIAKKL